MSIKVEDNFSKEEQIRYSRHFVLPGFGQEAQLKLKQSKIIVIGAGGLGCPVLLYLTAAGAGTIAIVDDDQISLSNLQRQVLYTTEDLTKSKASVAVEKLKKLNPEVDFHPIGKRITSENALTLLVDYDVVVDWTENLPKRYLLNDASVILNKPLVYGSIFRYEGQVSVFNYHRSPNYRDLYPVPPAPDAVPDCEEGGVLGVLAGIIGSMQASEAIKIASGYGETLSGRLMIFDSHTFECTQIKIPDQNSRIKIKSLINYDEFCGIAGPTPTDTMKEVTVQELKALMDSGASFQLIDVREPHEYDICNLGGELIPQGEIPHHVASVAKDKQVILQCRSGARSGNMVQWLEKNHGFTNLYNLKGGILAWAREIDTTMPTY
jgi:sulfur-carrier protein adenylyltransferase/sulfurtransferase